MMDGSPSRSKRMMFLPRGAAPESQVDRRRVAHLVSEALTWGSD